MKKFVFAMTMAVALTAFAGSAWTFAGGPDISAVLRGNAPGQNAQDLLANPACNPAACAATCPGAASCGIQLAGGQPPARPQPPVPTAGPGMCPCPAHSPQMSGPAAGCICGPGCCAMVQCQPGCACPCGGQQMRGQAAGCVCGPGCCAMVHCQPDAWPVWQPTDARTGGRLCLWAGVLCGDGFWPWRLCAPLLRPADARSGGWLCMRPRLLCHGSVPAQPRPPVQRPADARPDHRLPLRLGLRQHPSVPSRRRVPVQRPSTDARHGHRVPLWPRLLCRTRRTRGAHAPGSPGAPPAASP
jgi:hypothetical protein